MKTPQSASSLTSSVNRRRQSAGTLIVGVLALAAGAAWSGDPFMLNVITTGVVLYPLAMSFNLLLGYAGLPSFAHPVYFGIGAYASAYAAATWDWDLVTSTVFAVIVSAVSAGLTALPTMRQRSHFLAIATLALLITANELFLQLDDVTGGVNGFVGIPVAEIGSIELAPGSFSLFVAALVVAVAAQLFQDRMLSARFGRKLAALRTTPLAARSVGVNLAAVRLTTFVIAGGIAGLSGVLYARHSLFISPADFGLERAVDLLFVLVLGGMGTRLGPLLGVSALLLLREVSNSFIDYRLIIFGVLIVLVLTVGKQGLGGLVSAALGRASQVIGRMRPESHVATSSASDPVLPEQSVAGRALRLSGVQHRFAGVRAVDDVALELPAATIGGIIGPNGAGKTTLFNIITGVLRPSGGSVRFGDAELVGRTIEQVADTGVVRTFQHAQMVPELSLLENTMLGCERFGKATLAEQLLHAGRASGDEERFRAEAVDLLAAMGITDPYATAEEVSYGVLRRAEIARCLAARPDTILLDEPGAGLNDAERDVLLPVLHRLREMGVSVLLIDHNVGFVSEACSAVWVLVNGAVITSGPPEDVVKNPEVLRAYIGTTGRPQATEEGTPS